MSPRVLVISNTALTTSNSNGRTLGFLLADIEKENLMQFCIKEEPICGGLVKKAYCITDSMILKGAFKREIISEKLLVCSEQDILPLQHTNIKKTAMKFLVREIAWGLKIRCTDFFSKAKAFQPDVILFQMGTSGFLAKLAYDLSRICNAKLIVYTTEDYYFKTWNFIQPNKKTFAFAAYMAKYRKAIKKVFQNTTVCIANTPDLAEVYHKEFGIKVDVIMAAASESIASYFQERENTVVYAGNLTLNRHKSIIDIAKVVLQIDSDAVVTVYGTATPEIEEEMAKQGNISLKGFVKYDTLLPRLANARLLIHCESFDEFYKKDLQAAFSTKIADSLASGVPLLLFAPESFSETKYLVREACAIVCTDSKHLKYSVEQALNDDGLRQSVGSNARKIVSKNHDSQGNQKKMYDIICSAKGDI